MLHLPTTALALDDTWQAVLEAIPLPPVQLRLGVVHIPSWLGNRLLPRWTVVQAVRLGAVPLSLRQVIDCVRGTADPTTLAIVRRLRLPRFRR